MTVEIGDDEIVLRHIPGGATFQKPGPILTRGNFKLRHEKGETGLSVSRQAITGAAEFLRKRRTSDESRVAAARVGDIRALGLKVVPRPLDQDPGHAEIQSDSVSLDEKAVRKGLSKLFRFIDVPPELTA